MYGGDVQKLIMSEDDKKFPEWNGCKNVLLFTPKVTDCDACPDKGGFWVIHKHKGIYDRLLETKESKRKFRFVTLKFIKHVWS